MDETNAETLQLELHVEAPDDEIEESDWQGECRQLYNQIVAALDEGDVQPATRPAQVGEKAGVIEMFGLLLASGVTAKAFSGLYQVAKLWLEHRPRCEVTLKFPDGCEIKVQRVSIREAEQLMREHQQRLAQA